VSQFVSSRCDQCGQTDTHPKVHSFGGGTHHHDCLSADAKADLGQSSDKAAAIIAARPAAGSGWAT